MVAVAGASLVGGMMSADASKSAANQQAGAANNATQAQRDMFNQQVQMEAPYRQAGLDATSKLSYLLGISPTGYGSSTGSGGVETADAIRARLAPQFTTTTQGTPASPAVQAAQAAGSLGQFSTQYDADGNPINMGPSMGVPSTQTLGSPGTAGQTTTNTAALDAAVQAELSRQQAAASQTASTDPAYGSLLKNFDTTDFQLDPGYQFQLNYGQQALQNSQAAQNGVLSGAALKGLIGFNQDYAGQGYQSAYDRYMTNKGFTLGSLSDLSKLGQAAASNAATGGSSYASGIAGSLMGAGNAQAAGTVGSANAISGGLSSAANSYFLSGLLNNGGSSGTSYGAFQNSPMSNILYSNASLGD